MVKRLTVSQFPHKERRFPRLGGPRGDTHGRPLATGTQGEPHTSDTELDNINKKTKS